MALERTATVLRFSTTHMPAAERLSAWNNQFGRSMSKRLLVPPPRAEGDFHIEMTAHPLEADECHGQKGSVLDMSVTRGGTAHRSPALLSDGNDDVVLHLQIEGSRNVSQRGREVTIEAGSAVLTSNADASRIVLPGPARFACIAIPRKVAMMLAPAVEDALLRRLPRNDGVLKLLRTYLGALNDDEALGRPELRSTVATHLYDLCALAIGAARDAAEVAVRRGLATARLRAMKRDVARNLVHGDVSTEALARRQGVTPRYVHKLFELDGTTLSKFKLGLRLSRVRRMLVSHGGLTISEIAYRAGFNDLSTFNREFRRHFGATPSEFRAWART